MKKKERRTTRIAKTKVEMLIAGSLRSCLFGHGEENVVTKILYEEFGKNRLRHSLWGVNGPVESLKYFRIQKHNLKKKDEKRIRN